jgi:hypothetical protein
LQDLIREMGLHFTPHRKLWEISNIASAINDVPVPAAACGFGVGTEELPALFASWSIPTLATDQESGEECDRLWGEGQWCRGRGSLYREWCPQFLFDRCMSFRRVDMRAIPDDLGMFDFLWSCSSLEHLGSLEAGLTFLVESSRHLKPGGVAVHTTEFNLSSETETIESGWVVVYRRCDLETLPDRLATVGCTLDPIDWTLGDHEMDRLVDPMTTGTCDGKHVHLKLRLGAFDVTSILLVIRKPA